MNKLETQCLNCPVRKTCPPEKRASRITMGNNPTVRTMDQAISSAELSNLRKELNINNCPPGERKRLLDPLVKLIHPNRHEFSSASIPSSAEDKAFREYRQAELHNKRITSGH